jgi:hypothetical protein
VSVVDKVVDKKGTRGCRGIPEVPVVTGRPGNRRQQLPAPA